MSDKLRPQDKWNQKNGFVSKSYKLNKTTINSFAKACEMENVSQAGQLTRLMLDYSVLIERRDTIMYVKEKYSSQDNYQSILQTLIEDSLAGITDEEIEMQRKQIMNMLSGRPLFYKITDVLDYNKTFHCYQELIEYFRLGAVDIVEYVKNTCIKEIVYFKLVNDGILMPVTIRQNVKISVDIHHNHGNTIFDIYFDMFPYESFALVTRLK